MPVQPCQSLFVAPCSHVWHFKCIRPILNDHKSYPQFICPNCRAVANLEEDVDEIPVPEWEEAPEDGSSPELAAQADETILDSEGNIVPASPDGARSIDEANPAIGYEAQVHETPSARGDRISTSSRNMPTVNEPSSISSGNGAEAASAPINIRNTWNQTIEMPINPMASMNLGTSAERLATINSEGPLTPRNDAGPFVFDGSAGRASGRGLADTISRGA